MTLNLWTLLFGAGSANAGTPGQHPLTVDAVPFRKTVEFEGDMATTVEMVQGDTGGAIRQTLKAAGVAQDLSGATVTAQLRHRDTGAVITVACDVVDAANGVVEIPAAARASWPFGIYQLRFLVVYADTSKDVFPSGDPNLVVLHEAWT